MLSRAENGSDLHIGRIILCEDRLVFQEEKPEARGEAAAITQGRSDGGLDQSDKTKGGKMKLDSEDKQDS